MARNFIYRKTAGHDILAPISLRNFLKKLTTSVEGIGNEKTQTLIFRLSGMFYNFLVITFVV